MLPLALCKKIAALGVLLIVSAQSVLAVETTASAILRTDHLNSRLVSLHDHIVPGRPLQLGLLLEHDPHWHTYWKNPGDSGLPTVINLKLPAGFSATGIQWPLPERLPFGDMVNYGYS